MKKCKEKNEKSIKRETVGAVTHTHTHTHKHVIKDNVGAGPVSAHEKKENRRIRTRVIVPLIVVLVLINIIAVVCVGAPFRRPSETAELNRDIEPNKEEILAKTTTTTVQVGGTYIVPKDGIYKIELHGGKGGSPNRTTTVLRFRVMLV